MSDSASMSLPLDSAARGGGREEVQWVEVMTTTGLLPARIIAGRLEASGIPVRVWQEAAGQAFGLTVGPLGTGHIAVPAEFVDAAEALLAEEPVELDEADLAAFDEEE